MSIVLKDDCSCMPADEVVNVVTRNTVQRTLVLEAVRSLHNHPTSADVYEVVREQHPNISRATVYRNLGVLAKSGEVLKVEVPNGADRYDFRNESHRHAKCRMCGSVCDIEMGGISDLVTQVQDTHGFVIENCEVIFDGVCAKCAQGKN